MVKNILGNGIDIPLLGLREASVEVTGELHELFTDESYKISQCFLLSTSQVPGRRRLPTETDLCSRLLSQSHSHSLSRSH